VWVLAVGLVMVAAGAAGSAVATAHLARQQARVAADFGALAGAARVLDGPAAACVRAEELARANGGRMAACHVDGLDLQVIVEVDVTPLPGLSRTARATARAGPVRG
jgi:secretion/DNA translocation related TadE-like protein